MAIFFALLLGCLAGPLLASSWVVYRARPRICAPQEVVPAQTAIVLGAFVYNNKGALSPVLQDRVDTAIALYDSGKVDCLLMSGDHGQDDYDEVNAMRIYAEKRGVPRGKIFLDHAGFNTYQSMVRARKVFEVTDAVVVTNRFHLERAVFLASCQGIRVQGVVADKRRYADDYELREFLARCKAFLDVYLLRPRPKYLGPVIPITGEATPSHDKP